MHGPLDRRIHGAILLSLACHRFHQKDALPGSWGCVKVATEEDCTTCCSTRKADLFSAHARVAPTTVCSAFSHPLILI